ncbi:MAG: hypothetical protein E6Q68_03700 [Polynucleobacter sp.]|nr:MAG: hypothetical protein E6Q68_03700 [Polynucleobacter sp.]
MSVPNFLFVPSKMATVNQGRLLEVLAKVGNVYQTCGTAEQTIQHLRNQGVLPKDMDDDDDADIIEFFVVVAPPPPFTPIESRSEKDRQKIKVGRGIFETIEELKNLPCVEVLDILFVADNPTLSGQSYADNLRIKLTEYTEGDEIENGDWKTSYAEYPTEPECHTWEDICDHKEFDALEPGEVIVDRSKVVCADADAFPGYTSGSSGKRMLLVARLLGFA